MKIPNAQQIRELDAYTIENEPVASIDLMERASRTFVNWFVEKFPSPEQNLAIFCGIGNNGGDGLAIARMLYGKFYKVEVFLCKIREKTSDDYNINLEKLKLLRGIPIHELSKNSEFPDLDHFGVLIDAIFGSGLSRSIEGYWGKLVDHLNQFKGNTVAVDIPSGLFADQHSSGHIFRADHCYSFEFPKYSFFFPENFSHVGNWAFGSIGLSTDFIAALKTNNFYIDSSLVRSIYKKREKFDHKGNFGHALLVCGSLGMMGAAILASRACLRSGVGLLTIHIPQAAYEIMQMSVPEAMVQIDENKNYFSELAVSKKFSSIGVGCGLGGEKVTEQALLNLLEASPLPLVLDADALNIISRNPDWIQKIPEGSILTPHPKEFVRLFGETLHDFERNRLQREKAMQYRIYIVLKGAHSCIATPEGDCYFNSTGNPGMATAGSGDVLTGIITGLLAQSYNAFEAAVLAVYLHGLAGDLAAEERGQEALLAGDIVDHLGFAFQKLKQNN